MPEIVPLSLDLHRWLEDELDGLRGELKIEEISCKCGVLNVDEYRQVMAGTSQGEFERVIRDWLSDPGFQGEPLWYYVNERRSEVWLNAQRRESPLIDDYFEEVAQRFFGRSVDEGEI